MCWNFCIILIFVHTLVWNVAKLLDFSFQKRYTKILFYLSILPGSSLLWETLKHIINYWIKTINSLGTFFTNIETLYYNIYHIINTQHSVNKGKCLSAQYWLSKIVQHYFILYRLSRSSLFHLNHLQEKSSVHSIMK